MSIFELGALGEFLGFFAVTITLVFLGLQIRQSTKVSRSISLQQWNLAVAPQNEMLVRDPEVAKLFLQYTKDHRALDPAQKYRVESYLVQMFNNFELLFLLYNEDTIDQEFFEGKIGIYIGLFQTAVIRRFWEVTGPKFLDPRFREFVDTRLREASES